MWLFYTTLLLTFYYGKSSTYTFDHAGGYLRDVDSDWAAISGRANQAKCIDIPDQLSLCNGIGYHQMRLPNLLGHDSIQEVMQQATSWVPLLGVECHPDTQLFLCSLFSPVCLDRPIYPCQSLCESVKNGCEQKMSFYGYNWPEMVRCSKFPNGSDLCIQAINNDTTIERSRNICSACSQPATYEGLIDNYCRASYVIAANIRRIKVKRNIKQLILKKKKKMIKKGGITKRERRKLNPILENVDCECDRINLNTTQKYIIMGNRTADGQFTVSYIGVWRRDRNFKKAIRKMRKLRKKRDPCNDIIEVEKVTENTISTGNQSSERKVKKNKKKDKVRGKKRKGKNGKRKRGRKRGRGNNKNSNAVTVPNAIG